MSRDDISAQGEWIERAALTALHRAAGADLQGALGLGLTQEGDTLVSLAPTLPASAITINRAMGLGRSAAPDTAQVERIVEMFDAAGAARFFLQPDPHADRDSVAAACDEVGLVPARAWQKFVRGPDAPIPATRSALTVREAGPEDGAAFARIACDAFDLGAAAEPWLARLPGAEGWRVFLSMDGDEPVGTGALFVSGRLAYTDFGATAHAHRGRGAQNTNLAFRVARAVEAGCDRIFTVTGVAVPGDPQHSYANILKCGFEETYARDTWARPKD